MSNKTILYISYDGMLEPLGQSQVISYQEKLAHEFNIHILSFEKSYDKDLYQEVSTRLKDAGIIWHRRSYHKSPQGLSTAYDILCGLISALMISKKFKVDIIHARSYVPSIIALCLQKILGIQYVFDMRGFWVDERVDGGLWMKDSYLYMISKWFESKFLLNANHTISLTHAAVREINKFPYLLANPPRISVIPTCTDLSRFQPLNPKSSAKIFFFTLGYIGSIGTWYNFDLVADVFKQLLILQPNSKLLIVNQNQHESIRDILRQKNLPSDSIEIIAAKHSDIPAIINTMSAGIFFIKPLFSKQASAPTKLGEFLACGKPCLSNRGVGDMTSILHGEGVGVTISDFSEAGLNIGIAELLQLSQDPHTENKCMAAAEKYFSLEQGVKDLKQIYHQLPPMSRR